jgi:hypothetical protein
MINSLDEATPQPDATLLVASLLMKVRQDFGARLHTIQADLDEEPTYRVELRPIRTAPDGADPAEPDLAPYPVLVRTTVEARVTVDMRSALYRATLAPDSADPVKWDGPAWFGRP